MTQIMMKVMHSPPVASVGKVYFSSTDGVLMRCPESGCASGSFVLAREPGVRSTIAVDAEYAFWLSSPAPASAGSGSSSAWRSSARRSLLAEEGLYNRLVQKQLVAA